MTNSQRMRESAVMISSTMPSAKYSGSGPPLKLAKGSTPIDGLAGVRGAGCRGGTDCGDAVDAHRSSNVLDALLAHILERAIELVAHLIAHDPAEADATRLSKGFQSRRDVDPVAKDVLALGNHVTEVDPGA